MRLNQSLLSSFFFSLIAIVPSLFYPAGEIDCCDYSRLSISGRVIDAETLSPIPNSHVYISGTTFGTLTNEDGKFELNGLTLGRHTLVISHVGYELVPVDITIIDKDAEIGEIKLKIKVQESYSVEINSQKDTTWSQNLRRFKKSAFGEFYDDAKIQIPNIHNLNYAYSGSSVEDGYLRAFSSLKTELYFIEEGIGIFLNNPFSLEIQNSHTGYILDYAIRDFYVGIESEDFILGYMRFEEMPPEDEIEKDTWEKNREDAYYGSLRHFLKSLINGDFTNEGYDVRITDLDPWDSKKRRKRKRAKVDTLTGTNIENRFKVSETEFENIKKIEFDEYIEIEFWNESDKNGETQKSWLKLKEKVLLVYDNGVLVDPKSVYLFGYLFSEGLYETLPFDYSPTIKN